MKYGGKRRITMAEVAVLISTLRTGNCRGGKGSAAEGRILRQGDAAWARGRICPGLSSHLRWSADQGQRLFVSPCLDDMGIFHISKKEERL